jgi:hypothetical protein
MCRQPARPVVECLPRASGLIEQHEVIKLIVCRKSGTENLLQ